jgi:hypothetical protein
MCLEPRGDEVHGGFEGAFFSFPIMRPMRCESGFVVIDSDKSKEVFEIAVLEELSTLHVEEDIPGVKARQPGETLPRDYRQCLDVVGVRVALRGLQRRLMPQAIEGLQLNSGYSCPRWRCRERADGPDPALPQPPDLITGDIGYEGQMIGCLPIRLAAARPATGATVTAWLAGRNPWRLVRESFQSPLRDRVVVNKVGYRSDTLSLFPNCTCISVGVRSWATVISFE